MSLLSVQQKLQLEQQIKLQQQENRQQMRRRESLVYGLKAANDDELPEEFTETKQETKIGVSNKGLVFRCIIAIFIFAIVWFMKYDGLVIRGINYETLLESLGNTDFINGIDFTNYITYTDN